MVEGNAPVTRVARACAAWLLLLGCSGEASDAPGGSAPSDAGASGAEAAPDASAGAGGESGSGAQLALPYATSVESITLGEGAGYNEGKLPDIVLGPPHGLGTGQGSLDVVSLGSGGEIVLGFAPRTLVDGPGPDFIVFENPFWPGGDPTQVYAELGEVSVSEDGETWHSFACDTGGDGEGHFPGCAGVTPTLEYDATELVPLDAAQSGGDAFDLAELGLSAARFVKIRDLRTIAPAGKTSGFDLDAVGVIHAGE